MIFYFYCLASGYFQPNFRIYLYFQFTDSANHSSAYLYCFNMQDKWRPSKLALLLLLLSLVANMCPLDFNVF